MRIAFGPVNEPIGWKLISITLDSMFLIDIFVNFNSAFYDDEYVIVQNRKVIAKQYARSWFLIDLLAIIPLEDAFS